jgi:hypothetical protein
MVKKMLTAQPFVGGFGKKPMQEKNHPQARKKLWRKVKLALNQCRKYDSLTKRCH